jgi:hypothetical protein
MPSFLASLPSPLRRTTPPFAAVVAYFAVLALLVPAAAGAQTPGSPTPAKKGFVETRNDSGAAVIFDDDQALGTGLDPFADIVKAPPRAARMNLLRPRNNFVMEMLKSVENI